MTIGPGERYRLDAVLGQGGAARVHRAQDTVLGRDVAVKVLLDAPVPGTSTGGESTATARARFVAEARTLAGLSHPHLVALLDAGFDDEHPFLVMQLVDGPSLAALVAATPGGLDPHLVATIGSQVADALAYTHAKGVVHRDVKPANIVVAEPHGPDVHAALADFGIARLLTSDHDATRHTMPGLAIGTAAYLAPEQVRGEQVTPEADVYALGLVLLEALTGRRTYPGPPIEAAVARLSSSPSIPELLPRGWRDLLTAMTRSAPSDRPDAEQVKVVLDALRGLRPVPPAAVVPASGPVLSADPVRPLTTTSRGLRRPLLVLAVAAVALVVGLGAAQLARSDSAGSPTPVTDTPDPPASAGVAGVAGVADVADVADVAVASSSPTVSPSATQPVPAVTTSSSHPKKPRRHHAPTKAAVRSTHGKKGR